MRSQAGRTFGLRLFAVAFFPAWTLFTLYPRPSDLVTSIIRVFNPPVDAEYAATLTELFQEIDDPAELEAKVKQSFPYQYDWVTYGVPWYFPTVEEAVERMAGDCKTQLVVLASILESREIPYTISVSPTHVWVEYDGRPANRIENAQVAVFTAPGAQTASSRERSLRSFLSLPAEFDPARSFEVFWIAFWDYMPADRKVSLAVGLVIAVVLFAVAGIRMPDASDLAAISGARRQAVQQQ